MKDQTRKLRNLHASHASTNGGKKGSKKKTAILFFLHSCSPGNDGTFIFFHDPSAMDEEEMEGRLLSVACQVDAR